MVTAIDILTRILSDPAKQIHCVLNKEKELENAEIPDNIEVGFEVAGVLRDFPEVGKRFNIVHPTSVGLKLFSTSEVQEIIYATDMEVKFKTINSIYLLVTPK